MLILSRKSGESFLIDDTIEVMVLDVQNDKVKIGINAPQNIKIIRRELREIERANLEAAKARPVNVCDMPEKGINKKKFK